VSLPGAALRVLGAAGSVALVASIAALPFSVRPYPALLRECAQEVFMGKVYAELDDRLKNFIARQPVFFVATAPSVTAGGDGGHVNVSPKGYKDTFAVLGPTTVAYVDLTGSGAETVAHLRDNGRITIMFCSFGGQAKILRIYGRGRVVLPCDSGWPGLAHNFPAPAGMGAQRRGRRSIIVVEVDRIADSCGYGVPVMELSHERDLMSEWSERMSDGELDAYRAGHNALSIDGLPALS
jgi:predicted pyridoxine 5'-phosphate oxidase superfamily flavin-nucleotide-binding protein